MKLRIHGNSIRLRLNRREVTQFAANARIEEACQWGIDASDRLVYGLETSQSAADIEVRIAGRAISVILPAALAQEWVDTDRVGVSASVALDGEKLLSIMVEKDFRRLHGANNDPDLYPNPLESKVAEIHSS